MITADEARTKMLTPRQRAAKAVADEFEAFIERGNPDASFIMVLDDEHNSHLFNLESAALIAELLEYRAAGWTVEFGQGYAQVSLPGVVS